MDDDDLRRLFSHDGSRSERTEEPELPEMPGMALGGVPPPRSLAAPPALANAPREHLAALLARPYHIEGAHYSRPDAGAMTNVKLNYLAKDAFDEVKEELDVALGEKLTQPEAMAILITFAGLRRQEFFEEVRRARGRGEDAS